MGMTLHRLQISLPVSQYEFLTARADREGVSIAEVVRRLLRREAAEEARKGSPDSLWEIAGIGEDRKPLLDGTPVSERPELYLTARADDGRREG